MKIIPKSEIENMNDALIIQAKKHDKEILKAVNPPKHKPFRQKREPAPRPRRIDISQLPSLNHVQNQPVSQYKEYKESLKKSALHIVSSFEEPQYQSGLIHKIATSPEVKQIVTEIIPIVEAQNNITALIFTILGKALENRVGI
jgi:hypothetical protein